MKRITFFILSILCITACNNEVEIIDKPQAPEPQIELIMPDAEEVSVYSTATENECKINEIWVLEFNSSNVLINSQRINGSQIVVNTHNQAAQLLPQLNFKPASNNTIVCIANTGVVAAPPANMPKANINTQFPLSKRYYSGGEQLPMYGELAWAGNNYTCEMRRAVAKVQVQMGTSVSDVTGNFFTNNNVTFRIFNSGNTGLIQTGSTNNNTTSGNTSHFHLIQSSSAAEALTHAYINEFPSRTRALSAAVDEDLFSANRQHIILKKINSATDSTFYRLDFYDSKTSKYIDTKRNHHYIFTINKVRSEGYSNLAQAQSNAGSNIEYTVRIEDDSRYITSNGQYAIITSVDTIKIPAGVVTNLEVAQFRYGGTVVGSVTTNSVAVESGSGLSITAGGAITNSNKPLRITATNTFTNGVIAFKYGNITHRIIVKRE